jgi:hypothetical protein
MMKLETIEHARFRALAQITIDKEKGVEAFEEYMKIAFPYLEATKKRERKHHIEKLQQEVSRGALVVQAVDNPLMRSRIATARQVARATPQSKVEEKQLYRKIGRHL